VHFVKTRCRKQGSVQLQQFYNYFDKKVYDNMNEYCAKCLAPNMKTKLENISSVYDFFSK